MSASPTESARTASYSGSAPGPVAAGSGTSSPNGDSGRDRRAWSMFRHTRDTTVVSQLPRFSTALVSVRLKRTHAS
jgi:hypothetical protein